jgi:hypothetical protein
VFRRIPEGAKSTESSSKSSSTAGAEQGSVKLPREAEGGGLLILPARFALTDFHAFCLH